MQSSELFKHIMVDDTESRKLFLADFEAEVEELSGIFSRAFSLLEEFFTLNIVATSNIKLSCRWLDFGVQQHI